MTTYLCAIWSQKAEGPFTSNALQSGHYRVIRPWHAQNDTIISNFSQSQCPRTKPPPLLKLFKQNITFIYKPSSRHLNFLIICNLVVRDRFSQDWQRDCRCCDIYSAQAEGLLSAMFYSKVMAYCLLNLLLWCPHMTPSKWHQYFK